MAFTWIYTYWQYYILQYSYHPEEWAFVCAIPRNVSMIFDCLSILVADNIKIQDLDLPRDRFIDGWDIALHYHSITSPCILMVRNFAASAHRKYTVGSNINYGCSWCAGSQLAYHGSQRFYSSFISIIKVFSKNNKTL